VALAGDESGVQIIAKCERSPASLPRLGTTDVEIRQALGTSASTTQYRSHHV